MSPPIDARILDPDAIPHAPVSTSALTCPGPHDPCHSASTVDSVEVPQVPWSQALLATTFTTLILWAVLGWARATGKVSTVHVTRREQRWPLLLVALVSILGGIGLLVLMHAEAVMVREVLLILSGLLITGTITLVWKISIHVAVASFVVLHAFAEQSYGPYLAVMLVALTSWSRVQLTHHTSSQVFAGAIVGALVAMLGLIPLN